MLLGDRQVISPIRLGSLHSVFCGDRMAGMGEVNRRWFRFSIVELLAATLLVGIGCLTVELCLRFWSSPPLYRACSYFPFIGGAIGILARQFRGGLVGVISGGCLGIAVMFGIMIYAIL
jgi:hypothetical protein